MRKVVIVQARMASSRLPGKVLMDIGGVPMLQRVVDRARLAKTADALVVATSTEASDDGIVSFCAGRGITLFRGSHFDVLDRFHGAASENRAEIVIRITADCPLIDPGLLDLVVATLSTSSTGQARSVEPDGTAFDLAANRLPPPWRRTYPIGLDVEACTFSALDRAWREATDASDREHVMPYLYRGLRIEDTRSDRATGTSANGFRVALLNSAEDLGTWRWTVDTQEDLEFVRRVYENLPSGGTFDWQHVVRVIRAQPELLSINAAIQHKAMSEVDERSRGNSAR